MPRVRYAHTPDGIDVAYAITGDGPPLLVGGMSDQTFARVARYANGYLHGGGPPQAFVKAAEKARAAWLDAGRPDRLQLWGMGYYALGAEAVQQGSAYLRNYYAFAGPGSPLVARVRRRWEAGKVRLYREVVGGRV